MLGEIYLDLTIPTERQGCKLFEYKQLAYHSYKNYYSLYKPSRYTSRTLGSAGKPTTSIDKFGRDSIFMLDEEHQNFCWLSSACVFRHGVHATRSFVNRSTCS